MIYEPKTISRDIYLMALGLFALGNDHFTRGQEVEERLIGLLGLESGSHVSDALFEKRATPTNFDEALKRVHIEVETK